MSAWTQPALAVLPLALALIARLHGGGLWPDCPKLVLKIAFAAPFGLAAWTLTGQPVAGLIGWAVMGLKGCLIGLPTGPGALALAVLLWAGIDV